MRLGQLAEHLNSGDCGSSYQDIACDIEKYLDQDEDWGTSDVTFAKQYKDWKSCFLGQSLCWYYKQRFLNCSSNHCASIENDLNTNFLYGLFNQVKRHGWGTVKQDWKKEGGRGYILEIGIWYLDYISCNMWSSCLCMESYNDMFQHTRRQLGQNKVDLSIQCQSHLATSTFKEFLCITNRIQLPDIGEHAVRSHCVWNSLNSTTISTRQSSLVFGITTTVTVCA